MKRLILLSCLLPAMLGAAAKNTEITIDVATGAQLRRAIDDAVAAKQPDDTLTIRLANAVYDFYPSTAAERRLFISNHDQTNPKAVGLTLEGARNVTIDGGGADLLFHGRMLPIIITGSRNCTLTNLAIDFPNPHISQVVIERIDSAAGTIAYRPEPWVDWHIDANGNFTVRGLGWEHTPQAGIAFERDTRRVAYRTGDIGVGVRNCSEPEPGLVVAPWRNPRLSEGMRVAMRTYGRPTPGIFLDEDTCTSLINVQVHYAEGMGLIAQNCRDISLYGFGVCLRGENDPRFFTTQADATHFSGCSGVISSVGGLYEGMMDDAINVHGTYLKLTERIDDRTVRGRYMHHQTYGFTWGAPGDTVQLVASATMDTVGAPMTVAAISPTVPGEKEFTITFDRPLPPSVNPAEASFGIENLTRTPEVFFAGNTVRNNRARGALFSTPRKTVCSDNLFDHTSGTAVLLCGDCNGWFETGACRDVTISGNRFVNALTSLYQFTDAVISISPEIPDLDGQREPFHSNITITGNTFLTFDNPLLFAKSVRGLRFENNRVEHTTAYPAFHPNTDPVRLLRCTDTRLDPQ